MTDDPTMNLAHCQVTRPPVGSRPMAPTEPAPTAKRAAGQAAVLEATEALLSEGAKGRRPEHRAHRHARGHLAHRALLLLQRQAELLIRPTGEVSALALPAGRHLVLGARATPAEELRHALRTSPPCTASTACCCGPSSRSRPTTRTSPPTGASCSGASRARRHAALLDAPRDGAREAPEQLAPVGRDLLVVGRDLDDGPQQHAVLVVERGDVAQRLADLVARGRPRRRTRCRPGVEQPLTSPVRRMSSSRLSRK